ncbi:hypothetical protein [Nocardioides sediminis]|uniref:hypothetical protein n=1 Tax=Nocardioides sediminis TaxID=433648 RepID=UPI000D31B8F8|nr:hypothetical protein [Nocardioides sediminis]
MPRLVLIGQVLLLGLLGLGSTTPAGASEVGGSVHAADDKLRRGCHTYSFDYTVRTPFDDWSLETTVVDPRGEGVASHAFLGPYDPQAQRAAYRLCRWATRPGRFTVRAKLVAYDDPSEGTEVLLPEATFRLRRR